MLKGWDRFCLYNIKIRRHCEFYVKLLCKLFKGLNFFKSWKLLLMKKIYRLKPNWRFSHSTMPSKKQPPFWSPVPVIPELAALVSGYPPHLNPRRGPASHPRGELGAVMQRGAGARARQLQHQMSPLIKLPLTRNRNMPFKFKQQITPPAFHLHNC